MADTLSDFIKKVTKLTSGVTLTSNEPEQLETQYLVKKTLDGF